MEGSRNETWQEDEPSPSPQERVPQQPPDQYPQRGPGGQQMYQQPGPSMFSSERIYKTLGMALVLGVVLLLVGGILVSVAGYYEPDDFDDFNTQENIRATGVLIGSIGLFSPGIVGSFALFNSRDLSDTQKQHLLILVGLSLIAFAILITTGFGAMIGF